MAGGKVREIKTRIVSVKNTSQVTKAMDIVSSTKFKKFSGLVAKTKDYYEGILDVLDNISVGVKSEKHPLFDGKAEVKKIGLIVIASDRGLCGGYNSNIIKLMNKFRKENSDKSISVISVGKKVRDYCRKYELDMKAEYIQLIPEIMFEKAKEISENITEFFYEDIFDEVYIIYSKFISSMNSELTVKQLLPVERPESKLNKTYIFEPSPEKILDIFLPKYLNIQIYRALLESTTSEHAARMNAMKNASDNAKDMIKNLTMEFNRARQAAITQEISEIVAGSDALN